MSKGVALEKDWYKRVASKRERATPILTDIAESSVRNLDAQMAQAREARRRKREARQMRPVDMSERLTIAYVADFLKVKPSTVYDWIEEGLIEAEPHGPTGRLKRITRNALEEYLRKR